MCNQILGLIYVLNACLLILVIGPWLAGYIVLCSIDCQLLVPHFYCWLTHMAGWIYCSMCHSQSVTSVSYFYRLLEQLDSVAEVCVGWLKWWKMLSIFDNVENNLHSTPTWLSGRLPHWPSGEDVHLKSGRSGVRFPLSKWRFCKSESYQWLKKLAFQRLPYQIPGVRGSVLGLVGLVSVYCELALQLVGQCQYCDWVREILICNFYLIVAACKTVRADLSLRYTSILLGRWATNKQNSW